MVVVVGGFWLEAEPLEERAPSSRHGEVAGVWFGWWRWSAGVGLVQWRGECCSPLSWLLVEAVK